MKDRWIFSLGFAIGCVSGLIYNIFSKDAYLVKVSDDNGDHIVGVYTAPSTAQGAGRAWGDEHAVGEYSIDLLKYKVNDFWSHEQSTADDNFEKSAKAVLVDGKPKWVNK